MLSSMSLLKLKFKFLDNEKIAHSASTRELDLEMPKTENFML